MYQEPVAGYFTSIMFVLTNSLRKLSLLKDPLQKELNDFFHKHDDAKGLLTQNRVA